MSLFLKFYRSFRVLTTLVLKHNEEQPHSKLDEPLSCCLILVLFILLFFNSCDKSTNATIPVTKDSIIVPVKKSLTKVMIDSCAKDSTSLCTYYEIRDDSVFRTKATGDSVRFSTLDMRFHIYLHHTTNNSCWECKHVEVGCLKLKDNYYNSLGEHILELLDPSDCCGFVSKGIYLNASKIIITKNDGKFVSGYFYITYPYTGCGVFNNAPIKGY